MCLLVDKEEIGSVGATGMQSHFFENTVAELIALTEGESELKVRRALSRSRMLSSDVSAAYDPLYAEHYEKRNSGFFGRGISMNKFTGVRGKSGSNDANAEYIAVLRKIFDDANVAYQFDELGKVDAGGGGTIAYIMANYGMEVIDSGIALLCMHAPYEVSSKADIYEAVKGYRAIFVERIEYRRRKNGRKTKKLTMGALILMIFTSVYGFNNMPRSFYLMGYGAIPFFLLSAVLFFVPFAFMVAEYGSAFKDEKGGIFSWMQICVGTKYAFVATFMWYTSLCNLAR